MEKPSSRDIILYCTFCGKHQNDVNRLIASTPKLCICDKCVEDGLLMLTPAKHENFAHLSILKSAENPDLRCSFCHKASEDRYISKGTEAQLCGECVQACYDLLLEENTNK